MRNIIILAAAGLALCGCATDPSVQRQAEANCQAVGIGENDPQFATCRQAYGRQYLDDRLEKSYRDAQRSVPTDVERRMPHQETF